MRIVPRQRARRIFAALLAPSIFLTLFSGRAALAQVAPALKSEDTLPRKNARQPFRIETLPVGQGAEMLTVFGSDLADPGRDVWQRVFWLALQNVVIGPYGVFARSSAHALRNNSTRYRQAHVLRALVANDHSFVPTILALTGQLEDGTRPVPALWRQGFRTFPGRVINELFTTTQPEALLADTTTKPEEQH